MQALRRSAGLDLTDRIAVGIEAGDDGLVRRALMAHGAQIAADVLAVEVRPVALPDPAAGAELELDGESVRVSIARIER